VSIKRAGVAEIDEFSFVSAVSCCISSQLEGISEFPGFGVLAGSFPGLFLGKGVRTAKSALCLEGCCCFSNSYLVTLQSSTFAAVTSLCLWPGGVSGLQVIDFVVI